MSGGRPHLRRGQPARAMPHESGREWIGNRPCVDPVAVLPPRCAPPGVELFWSAGRRQNDDLRGQRGVHRALHLRGVEIGREGRDLPLGVHPGIGPPGHRNRRDTAEDANQDVLDRALHSPNAPLPRPPVEVRAVVGDDQLDDGHMRGGRSVDGAYSSSAGRSSMRAMGAPSPWRCPSFRIRVYPPVRSA